MGNNRVIKSDSGLFFVQSDESVIKCKARSRLKKDSIIVGDLVTFDAHSTEPVIGGIKTRKNKLIRPSIANVDQVIIIVAAVPSIDYLLIDKLIINAASQSIDALICLNKSDISLESLEHITAQYSLAVEKIIVSSAIGGEVDAIKPLLKDKLTCIAGQSAVGKSTIINALLGNDSQRTGQISKRIQRGKNTTTTSEIFSVYGGFIADTPGFSVANIFDILPEELSLYYPEFEQYRGECKFSTCTHISEPQCAVKDALERGEINIDRYDRYKKIYQENKDVYDRNPKLK